MTKVAVVGATGYAGAELTQILAKHDQAEIVGLFSSKGGKRAQVTPQYPDLYAEPFDMEALGDSHADVVFLATPNEVSAELAPEILEKGMKVIDLSGAFRLEDPALYPTWYGFAHDQPELLHEAISLEERNGVGRGFPAQRIDRRRVVHDFGDYINNKA